MKSIITPEEWEYLSSKDKEKYILKWQFKSFNYMWITGYDNNYPVRQMYYLKKL